MLNRLAKEHASMAGGIVLRQEPTDVRLNDRCGSLSTCSADRIIFQVGMSDAMFVMQ